MISKLILFVKVKVFLQSFPSGHSPYPMASVNSPPDGGFPAPAHLHQLEPGFNPGDQLRFNHLSEPGNGQVDPGKHVGGDGYHQLQQDSSYPQVASLQHTYTPFSFSGCARGSAGWGGFSTSTFSWVHLLGEGGPTILQVKMMAMMAMMAMQWWWQYLRQCNDGTLAQVLLLGMRGQAKLVMAKMKTMLSSCLLTLVTMIIGCFSRWRQ